MAEEARLLWVKKSVTDKVEIVTPAYSPEVGA